MSAAVGDLVVVVESEVSGAPFPNETTAAVCQSAADFGIWNPKKKNKISAATSMKKEVRQKKKTTLPNVAMTHADTFVAEVC